MGPIRPRVADGLARAQGAERGRWIHALRDRPGASPLALSGDGKLLFAANTPDNRLEVLDVGDGGLRAVGSVAVGLEPVAIAVRGDREIWVVNHLSDSVSIVDASDPRHPRVTRTLLVGDEPRDIVFAGRRHERAFITTAHRGQNSPDDPDLFVPSGRADVWVFDADALGSSPGGERLTKVTLFADTPRALAATADGKTVYAAAFMSGNQTTVASEDAVSIVYPSGMPGPGTITIGGQTIPQPTTGLIVKWKAGPDGTFHWLDAYGTSFDASPARVELPDDDVFSIDASADPPAASGVAFAHVGTTLFNMAVNPKSGKIYVSNTDAHNDVRFEGHTPGFTSVVGDAVDSRITVVDPKSGAVAARDLNGHLDHVHGIGRRVAERRIPAGPRRLREREVALRGGARLEQARSVRDGRALEAGAVLPAAKDQILLSGGGPTGVVLDERRGRAFVFTRFDDAISTVDLASRSEVAHLRLFNPEPPEVTTGRPLLYDATRTSALGDQACASCHIGGDLDGLAWDLGNPGNAPLPITTHDSAESDVFTIPQASIAPIIGADSAAAFLFSAYQPTKGANDDAESARPGTTAARCIGVGTATAPSSNRACRSSTPQGPLGDLRRSRTAQASSTSSTRSSHSMSPFRAWVGAASELSADQDMTSFANFVLDIHVSPEPDSQPRRLVDDGRGDRAELLSQRALRRERGALGSLPHLQWVPRPRSERQRREDPPPGLLRDRWAPLVRERDPDLQGPAPAERVPEGRNVCLVARRGPRDRLAHSPAQPAHTGRSRVRLPARRRRDGQHRALLERVRRFVQATVPVVLGSWGATLPPNPFGIPLFNDPTDSRQPRHGGIDRGPRLCAGRCRRSSSRSTRTLRPIVGQQITPSTPSNVDAAVAGRIALARGPGGGRDLRTSVVKGEIEGREAGFVYSWRPLLARPHVASHAGESAAPASPWRGHRGPHLDVRAAGLRLAHRNRPRLGDGYADGDEVEAEQRSRRIRRAFPDRSRGRDGWPTKGACLRNLSPASFVKGA